MRRTLAAAAAALMALGPRIAPAERPARPESGLTFAFALTNGGHTISSDRADVRIPDTQGTLAVRIEGFDVSGGAFSTSLRLENGTDAELYGLRVDHPSAAAPLTWEKLGRGETSTTLPFRASPVAFAPETPVVVVMGTVTGVAVTGGFTVTSDAALTSIDVDSSGDLVFTDAAGKTLRSGPDGSAPREIRKIAAVARPKSATGASGPSGPCTAARAAGHVCAEGPEKTVWILDGDRVEISDVSGGTLRAFRLTGPAPVDLAFSKTGRGYLLRRGGATTVLRSF
jgi:hypothetical protein